METTPFGHYQLRKLIGRGGMGEVYEAFDTNTDRVVALKVLPAHLAQDGATRGRLPLPDPLDERLPSEVVTAGALRGKLPLHDVLRGDAGVIHARHPQGLVPLHPAPADQRVLDRVV